MHEVVNKNDLTCFLPFDLIYHKILHLFRAGKKTSGAGKWTFEEEQELIDLFEQFKDGDGMCCLFLILVFDSS